ncbi:hypothetical protein LP417_07615 [Polaromonas sp. P1-6]|nr:hypothetical protein LP417_07615 [Polaromonas sp. P1-6]
MASGKPEMTPTALSGFAGEIVRWQMAHGRNSLPWQNTRDPYRVWLSEIMLQQTQVATVLDYYARFLQRFPTVSELAAAEQDGVLALWSGLGYYSRARNLHRCAQEVMALHARAVSAHGGAASDLTRHRPLDGGCHCVVLLWRACRHSGWQR